MWFYYSLIVFCATFMQAKSGIKITMKSVSVITVNYNHSLVTEQMLESISAHNTYNNIEVIVVDNGSKIDPVPGWTIRYPGVKFLRSETNLGFAGGNNLGLKIAKGDYVFFANNDTEFTDTLVEKLVKILDEHPQVGAVSPKIRYYSQPDTLQYVGFTPMNYHTARNKCLGQFEKDKGQYDEITGKTGYAHGAAMMVRRAAIEKAGPMAENYFLYYEEMDWCEKIMKAGFEIWVETKALIYHKESISVGTNSALKEYFMNRNRILFIRRNCDAKTRWSFLFYFLTVVTPRNVLNYIKDKQWSFIAILFRAISWNLTHDVNSIELGFQIGDRK